MINYDEFEEIVTSILERDISSNIDQKLAISSDINQSLFIVAGPGSGKTTVMVLKILKFIFVDDVAPKEILATTFTKKAANELLSRILSWGDKIKKGLMTLYMNKIMNGEIDDNSILNKLKRIDFNQINVGTIDSIADELLRVHRDAGTSQPILIEDFVANLVMINECLLKNDIYQNESLQEYLAQIIGSESLDPNKKPKLKALNRMADTLIQIKEQIHYNMLDYNVILNSIPPEENGKKITFKLIADYINKLRSRNIYDFAMIETEFLNRLNNGKLDAFLDDIKIVLVDEYQDTNLLQESIYFKIAESAANNGGSITVVGDDDQSLYGFRGASVELFTNFIDRVSSINIDVKEVNLKANYRSSKNIIKLCNDFVELDGDYQSARVKEKPKITFVEKDSDSSLETEIPILGMFRNSPDILALDLSKFIDELNRKGFVKRNVKRILTKENNQKFNLDNEFDLINYRKDTSELAKNKEIIIQLDKEEGSLDDIAFLTYSPKEISLRGNAEFPMILKKQFRKRKKPIEVFNPRGQDLQNVDSVAILCGLILECIDPDSKFQKNNEKLPRRANRDMDVWRRKAKSYIKGNPEPYYPISLEDFVIHWQIRHPFNSSINGKNLKWPKKVSLIELAYKLVTWISKFQDTDEGIVYLKAITQTITQTAFFSKYSANIDFSSYDTEKESINESLMNIFVPISVGGVRIDENLFEVIPSNRLNIMSIHQSKGLEFPLVIVDVGSRFKKNSVKDSNLRFPKKPNGSINLQERINQYSKFSTIDKRKSKDKSFDELTRLYFVSFSRAKDILLLVGLNSNIDGYNGKDKHMKIPNIALGWNRDEEFIGFDNMYLI